MANEIAYTGTKTSSGAIVLMPQCIPEDQAASGWVNVTVFASGKKLKLRKYELYWSLNENRLRRDSYTGELARANTDQLQDVTNFIGRYFATKRKDDARC